MADSTARLREQWATTAQAFAAISLLLAAVVGCGYYFYWSDLQIPSYGPMRIGLAALAVLAYISLLTTMVSHLLSRGRSGWIACLLLLPLGFATLSLNALVASFVAALLFVALIPPAKFRSSGIWVARAR